MSHSEYQVFCEYYLLEFIVNVTIIVLFDYNATSNMTLSITRTLNCCLT
jgi:hypothetical protein